MPSREYLRAVWHKGPDYLMRECGGQEIPHPESGNTLRAEIVKMLAKGRTCRQIADTLGCTVQWAHKVKSSILN